ncbi:MAG: hypothetical protein EZS28_025877 [Streblomastix strix]|uniref:U-box domain-containing protein n=1 Tax=Streblomastix strix TaxID=222440 RepID=A0A5J4V861_9EUKA|nr:MAG: hypothetical protein EZS28_025877 [Streblomastix strix]
MNFSPTKGAGAALYELQLRQKDEQIQRLIEENSHLKSQVSVYRQSQAMSVLEPFSYTFEEYIRQNSTNPRRILEKFFDRKLKGKIVKWDVQIETIWADTAQMIILPIFAGSTKPENLIEGQKLSIQARIMKLGNFPNIIELEAVRQSPDNIIDNTIHYSQLQDILRPFNHDNDEQRYDTWAGKEFSFIIQITMLKELSEDDNYCGYMNTRVIQPFHDNDIEPVVIFITKDNIQDLAQIKEYQGKIFDVCAKPMIRKDEQQLMHSDSLRPSIGQPVLLKNLTNSSSIQQQPISSPRLTHKFQQIQHSSSFQTSPPQNNNISATMPTFNNNKSNQQNNFIFPKPTVTLPKLPLLSKQDEIRSHFICELTSKIMSDPVSVNGHFYERNEILNHISIYGSHPATLEAITAKDIREELQLKSRIGDYLRDNPKRRSTT